MVLLVRPSGDAAAAAAAAAADDAATDDAANIVAAPAAVAGAPPDLPLTIPAVSEYNKLDSSESGGNGVSLTVSNASSILDDCHLGDSIAVNGVCLTVTEFNKDEFKIGIAPETLRRSNLGGLKTGDQVNLERAVAGHVRFGGHFVQGHVDTVGEIVSIVPDDNALTFTFRPRDLDVLKYVVEKGFIALDGTSLTVTAVDDVKGTFSVMLIAYTQSKVIIAKKKVGELVNIEVDFMGKLIEKQVSSLVEKQTNTHLEALVEKIVAAKLQKLSN
ncbi:riboflavin synthase [Sugiyamaella lignohabitans]|uniref:Riboflavin synthase n=1 Tax=Sugiyamaella lignohabitans TaxID=796027 RepID=A0A167CWU4_9ASCO|nr:riboflavin synthase [Sugiyamaella lignohabitans]ANB12201.1 riboflavin synthase [Sugiyamaella lignohabitans]